MPVCDARNMDVQCMPCGRAMHAVWGFATRALKVCAVHAVRGGASTQYPCHAGCVGEARKAHMLHAPCCGS